MFLIVIAGLVLFCTSSAVECLKTAAQQGVTSDVRMTVQPGDTLWQIAGRVGSPGELQSDRMNDIRALNPGLYNNPILFAGQTILVPVTASAPSADLHLAKASDSDTHSM